MKTPKTPVTDAGNAPRIKEGKHFRIPQNKAALLDFWNNADELDSDCRPSWAEPDDKIRGLGCSSWASVSAEDQDNYFSELEEMEQAGIIVDGDEGDGCVHHFYIRKV